MNQPEPAASLKTRVLSSLVLAPAAAALILWKWGFLALLAACLGIAVSEWLNFARNGKHALAVMLAGFAYLGLGSASYLYLRFGLPAGAWLSIAVIVIVAASDTGAYFTGRTIGGPKLAPRLSPKKTWAGFAGAMFWAGLALVLLAVLEPMIVSDAALGDIALPFLFLGGCLLGATGQAGDLFISFFKRRAGLKDTGHLIPGHGGLLDRIDALLLVLPVFTGLMVLL